MRSGSVFGGAVAGGILAATVVGLGEAALIALERGLGLDGGLLFFTFAFYGLAGLAAGAGAGIALAVVAGRLQAATAFALTGAALLAGLTVVIARFRIFRDVFHETFQGAPVGPLAFQAGSLVAALVLFVVAFLILRALARQQPWTGSALVAAGVLALALAGSWALMTSAPAHAPRAARFAASGGLQPAGPSVILVMVDTLRADHLSCYGYQASRTPAIDGLAADGTRFARAYSQASWTRPSVATILTSLYPSSHQAVHKSDVLPDDVVTLPEALQAAGYRTVGFANNINVTPLFNFEQGYDHYEFLEPAFFFGATEAAAQLTLYSQLRVVRERYLSDAKYVQHYYQPADVVTGRGLDWIEAHGDWPFFMFLHYMEPHDPYFVHPYNGEGYARVANPNPDPSVADRYREAYDGEIRYLDGEIGRLIAGLKARGLYDRTLIVFTADHGEEFHEHGGWWHGLTLYEEQIAIPLLVKPPVTQPGGTGAVNEGLVSTLDIAPTVLAIAGVPIPEVMQGAPLGLTAAAAAPRDHAFAEQDLEGNVLQAYVRETWKVIEANPANPRGLPPRQLFNLARDRAEQHDLAAAEAARVGELVADLEAVQAHAQTLAVESAETVIDSATHERLRALGYVH